MRTPLAAMLRIAGRFFGDSPAARRAAARETPPGMKPQQTQPHLHTQQIRATLFRDPTATLS
ncbi:MAG: hypothetical protein RH917_18635 [Lacipirellulaceae bacterium]